jgi:UDP-2-acetamido-2,6-beta-L-arabino-hexul-4-ose reductase
MIKIGITGFRGFIGKSVISIFRHKYGLELIKIDEEILKDERNIRELDWVLHFAGVNRANSDKEFIEGNVEYTTRLINYCESMDKNPRIFFSSSQRVSGDDIFAKTKKIAEELIRKYNSNYGFDNEIHRLPNIFGKGARPNYNSFIATFSFNLLNGIKIEVNENVSKIPLLYIDSFADLLYEKIILQRKVDFLNNELVHYSSPREIANLIIKYKEILHTTNAPDFSNRFEKNLYSTFISYLPIEMWKMKLDSNVDFRGSFTQLFNSNRNGQMSVIKFSPGSIRGDHFHESKIEKFIVIAGEAEIIFEDLISNDIKREVINYENNHLIYAIPGWNHKIVNTSKTETLIIIAWANENFDKENPDTYTRAKQ